MLDKMREFERVLEKDLREEVDKIIEAGTISPTDAKTMTDAVCLMLKTKEYENYLMESEMTGYSGAMDGDRSYRRERNPMNGRYVSNASMPHSWSPNSYNYQMNGSYGYSGHSIRDRAIAKLENMMSEAGSDYERQVISGMIDDLRMNR